MDADACFLAIRGGKDTVLTIAKPYGITSSIHWDVHRVSLEELSVSNDTESSIS